MAETITLTGQLREEKGKGANSNLRKSGLVPGVFYKGGEEAVALKFDSREVRALLQKRPPLFQVSWGQGEGETFECVLREIQYHPVSRQVVHMDLMGITRGVQMDVNVPLRVVGDPAGVKEGGVLNVSMNDVDIRCLPKDIPEVVEVDVSNLGIGDSIHLGDISLEGIEWITNSDRTVAAVVAPRVVADDGAGEGDELEEGAEAGAEAAEEGGSEE